ncbi:hypothetical protein NDA18_003829 [Ustilago nuda]|nr:hypothetical protein NDA18_003829 [Ustilago nuda]
MKSFSATLTIEQQHIQQCAYAILHLISFDRLLGTVKPAYVSVLGLQVPAISDPQLDAILLSRAAELASLVKGSEGSSKVELKVEFSIPTHPKARTSGGGGEHKGAGEAGGGGVGGMATNAASSIRAWATPWLASAFSGGVGQPAHPYICSPTPIPEGSEVFESWSITFQPSSPKTQDSSQEAQKELARITNQILTYITNHNSHLPTTSSPSPYPFHISLHTTP